MKEASDKKLLVDIFIHRDLSLSVDDYPRATGNKSGEENYPEILRLR